MNDWRNMDPIVLPIPSFALCFDFPRGVNAAFFAFLTPPLLLAAVTATWLFLLLFLLWCCMFFIFLFIIELFLLLLLRLYDGGFNNCPRVFVDLLLLLLLLIELPRDDCRPVFWATPGVRTCWTAFANVM